jgi:acyl-coenzyme A thioesterase PaaI-like protein
MKSPQPNSRMCFVCGIENPFGLHLRFYDSGPGEVTAEVTVSPRHQGYPGIVHGGVVAAMLDEGAGRSQMGSVENPRFMFTARLEVRYRKNVPVGKPLRLVGRAGLSKSRTAEATSTIYDMDGNILAEADALMVNVPPTMMESADPEALGWKVYPDEIFESGLAAD